MLVGDKVHVAEHIDQIGGGTYPAYDGIVREPENERGMILVRQDRDDGLIPASMWERKEHVTPRN